MPRTKKGSETGTTVSKTQAANGNAGVEGTTYDLGGVPYRIIPLEEWTVEQDEAALEVMDKVFDEFPQLASGETKDITVASIIKLMTQKKVHRDMLGIACWPVGGDFDGDALEENIAKMGKAKTGMLVAAVNNFFGFISIFTGSGAAAGLTSK